MDRGLAVIGDTDRHQELLREAGVIAESTGTELVLYLAMSEDEFQESFEAVEAIARMEDTGYDSDSVMNAARNLADDLAGEAVEGIDVEYEVAGEVVEENRAHAIIDAAEERGCDHIFIRGRRRSPTGKAVFGDTAQGVILNYDGYVTVATR